MSLTFVFVVNLEGFLGRCPFQRFLLERACWTLEVEITLICYLDIFGVEITLYQRYFNPLYPVGNGLALSNLAFLRILKGTVMQNEKPLINDRTDTKIIP